MYPNIDYLGRRNSDGTRLYTGYGMNCLWTVVRCTRGWRADCKLSDLHKLPLATHSTIFADTLRGISDRLAK